MDADRTGATFVVGTDSSPESRQAIEWARTVAGEHDQIVLVQAWQMPVVTGYDMVVTIDPHEIEQGAKDALAAQVDELADPRIVPVVQHAQAGRALVEEADARDATMIVVGHRGTGRMTIMLGSTASYVLHHTHRPVVVVRGDRAEGGALAPRYVVVGVDDHGVEAAADNPSVRALRWAYALPGVERVRVVHAWFLPSLAIGMFADASADLTALDAAAQAMIDRVIAAAGPAPAEIEVVGEPIRGTSGFGLIEESRTADLIVVGSRGRGGFSGLVLGSTSTEVAAHSHCPVAVIR